MAAGPIANFILAIVIFCGLFIHGMPDPVARLGTVPEHSIAANAGLRGGELITAVNGQAVRSWSELRWSLAQLAIEKTAAHLNASGTASDTQVQSKGSVTFSLDSVSAEDLEKDFMSRIGLLLKRPKAVLGEVLADGPAMLAGLHEGDLVVSVNGVQIADKIQLQEIVRAAPGKSCK